MSSSQNLFHLYDTETAQHVGDAQAQGLDVYFPEFVRGWSDVLDCRVPPYLGVPIEENCKLAYGVRKKFILVPQDAKSTTLS